MELEIKLLEKAGFTEAEAKVYLAFLKYGEMSGYEASKQAGIQKSKVYTVLESMKEKGFIVYTETENGNRYMAIPIKEISERTKRATEVAMDDLSKRLSVYPQKPNMDQLWHIKRYENVFLKCKELVAETKKELLLQIWEEDLPELIEELKQLQQREIPSSIVVFSNKKELELPLEKYYRHGMVEEKKEEMGGRWITLVSDGNQVVFGQIMGADTAEVIWSKSRPMISLAAECVRHDVYFYKCAGMFRKEMEAVYGNDLEKIREIY